ncbi:RagB/SusD family nutrient uptake outer membrane protein [Pedobacter nyackensis]|uniref:RagB/SusD family nutrient uptake outer membrane protein n=1 Tax=Pedobacter nyackensis TaxID=475255 RepID=UPI00292D1216|nr:RagB/SusD family nutrient uptake outer membrane protein [Pedobacter nyackensis]
MNKLNLNKLFLSVLIAGSMLSGCDKKIDLAPESVTTEKDALTHQKGTERLLAGTYLSLFDASKGEAYAIPDLTTGLLSSFSTDYATGNLDSRNAIVLGIWSNNYKTISLANVIINKLAEHATFDLILQKQFIAEAKFIRALSYFNLLKYFGDRAMQNNMEALCVPLRLQAFDGYDGSQNIPRSTNSAVYVQIIKDLDEAIIDLKLKFDQNVDQHGRATKAAARALASRVSLYRRDYAKCIGYATDVLADQGYGLETSVTSVFPVNAAMSVDIPFSKEIIFGFPVSWNKDVSQYKFHDLYYNYGFLTVNSTFLTSYNVADQRRADFYVDPQNQNRNLKFSHPDLIDNLMMIRVSEIMLNKAEAEAYQNGVTASAVQLLNDVYQRAFPAGQKPALYTTADFSTKEILIDRILQERLWELAFESHSRFDYIRSGLKPNTVLPMDKYALPIPQREIDITNGLIKQNPGY